MAIDNRCIAIAFETCERYAGSVKVIDSIEDREGSERILQHLGLEGEAGHGRSEHLAGAGLGSGGVFRLSASSLPAGTAYLSEAGRAATNAAIIASARIRRPI